jgi:hypothetical protein
MDIYLENKEVQELDGKYYLEINNWSIVKLVFLGGVYFNALIIGGIILFFILFYLFSLIV